MLFRSEDKKYSYAKNIADNANRLENLLNNLLDMSKYTADKIFVNFKEVDLDKLVKNIIDECNSLYLINKTININYISKNELLIIADKERISQVLRNLFFNAIKFTPSGGNIEVVIKTSEKMLHFSLIDSGIGIPSEELLEIFEAFSQSSRTKTRAGGTGLGLSIVKKIIDAHYGKVWATNNTTQGATFHFAIPLVQDERV